MTSFPTANQRSDKIRQKLLLLRATNNTRDKVLGAASIDHRENLRVRAHCGRARARINVEEGRRGMWNGDGGKLVSVRVTETRSLRASQENGSNETISSRVGDVDGGGDGPAN